MNKQELIEHISSTLDKYLKNTTFVKPVLTITEIAKSDEVSLEFEVNKNCILLDDNRQELNKPVVPQFVADWIKYCKFTHVDLQHALIVGDVYFYNYANQKDFSKLKEFLETENNQETFARAWLDGYTVKEEKRYFVKIRATKHCFAKDGNGKIFFSLAYKGSFTKVELEQTGFGWVFDCPGIEIEEVE